MLKIQTIQFFGMIFSMYFNKFLVFLFNSEVKDLTSGFIVGKKTFFQKKYLKGQIMVIISYILWLI